MYSYKIYNIKHSNKERKLLNLKLNNEKKGIQIVFNNLPLQKISNNQLRHNPQTLKYKKLHKTLRS